MSADDDLPPARSALKAAQSGLAEGLLRLRMASSARGIGAPLGEGEFLGGGGGASSGSSGGPSLRSQFSLFLPGGLGGGGLGGLRVDDNDAVSLGVRTILDLDVGSYQVIPGLEGRVETPLSSFERSEFARGGGGGGEAGAFSTPKVHLPPPPKFFFQLVAPVWALFLGLFGVFLSILLSVKVSSSERPISTSYAATLDPRHRVLGAWGRHGLWQGRGGLTTLVGRRNCLQPDRATHGASQAGPVLGTGLWQSTHRDCIWTEGRGSWGPGDGRGTSL